MKYKSGHFTASDSQTRAIQHPPTPLMILAGAGTGKTTTLLYRIKQLLEWEDAESETVVILTFTEKAAHELSQKVREDLGRIGEGVFISTFHGFCNQLVREFSTSSQREKLLLEEHDIAFLLLNRFDELSFLESHVFRANPVSAVLKSFLPFFNRVRDELLTPENLHSLNEDLDLNPSVLATMFPNLRDGEDIGEYRHQLEDLVSVYETYQSWKAELGVVDYADMIQDCWNMLDQNMDILHKVQTTYRHIVIDEYQDNNYALNKIIHLVAGDDPSITVVGDEDQCIYSFRGANYFNIQDFREHYQLDPQRNEVKLEENFRSTQEILDLANVSIAHDPNRTPKSLISTENRHGPKPILHIGEKDATLACLPGMINAMILEKGRRLGDVAILCRTRGQVQIVVQTLQQASLPVDEFIERFFDIPAIKDILAWSRVITDDPRQETALFRLLIHVAGKEIAAAFFNNRKSGHRIPDLAEWIQATDLPGNAGTQVLDLLETVDHLSRQNMKKRADEMIWEILKVTDNLKQTRRTYRYPERLALTNVGRLLFLADTFVIRESDPSLQQWLRYMDILALDFRMPAIQPQTYDQTAVQVMTIHKSKGLEFPVAMIPFLRSGSFPVNYRTSTMIDRLPEPWYHWPKPDTLTPRDEHFNEERRIFYVGVTRAQEELHLFGPEKAQSLFLKEVLKSSQQTLEIQAMDEYDDLKNPQSLGSRERLLVELNRELAAHQYENARSIIDGLGLIDKQGHLPPNHPYVHLTKTVEDSGPGPDPSEEILSLSASSIEEYERCPYKFRLGKIDKIPERKSRAEMEFGNIIHKVLEDYHASKEQTLDRLLDLLDTHWRQNAFEYFIRESEFKHQAREILTHYHTYRQAHPLEVVAREAFFDFVLEDLKVRIRGKIDRIDMENGQLVVTDYKTSKRKDPKARNSLQLALYTEALNRDAVENASGIPALAQLHYLRHYEDPLDTHTFTQDDLEQFQGKVRKAAKGIRGGDFEPKPSEFVCSRCDYKEFLCPAWESD